MSDAKAEEPKKTTSLLKSGSILGKNKPAEKKELPNELKNKTVKEALEYFEAELDKQVKQFQSQARQIARWDRDIFECIELMQHLETQIKAVEGAQKDLSQTTESLIQEQESFLKTLEEAKGKSRTQESEDQRQKLYKLAHKISNEFLEMESQLKSIVEETNMNSTNQATTDVGKIEQIANCHLDAMRWIEHQSNALEDKLNNLSKKLNSVSFN